MKVSNLLALINLLANFGVIGFIGNLIRKRFPSNYEYLHVNVAAGGTVSIPNVNVQQSLNIQLSNASQTNFYVARAYFSDKQRVWWTLWLWNRPTPIQIHPNSARIADKNNAFELKFLNRPHPTFFTEYETVIRPGNPNLQTTWLALEGPVEQRLINDRKCGVLYIEYATANKQGIHRVRV